LAPGKGSVVLPFVAAGLVVTGGVGTVTAGPVGGGNGVDPCPQTKVAKLAMLTASKANAAARKLHFIGFLPCPCRYP
jgi:hypothetical protein